MQLWIMLSGMKDNLLVTERNSKLHKVPGSLMRGLCFLLALTAACSFHYLLGTKGIMSKTVFQNRPYTTLEFERQVDRIFQWMMSWNHEEKCAVLEKLLQFCKYAQMRFLWTVLEPMVHRDFIYSKFDAFPKSSFQTLSTYVTRELYDRLAKSVNKYRRRRAEIHRIPSSLVKDEDEVKHWTTGSVLPVLKPAVDSMFEDSKSKAVRIEETTTCSSGSKDSLRFPSINKTNRKPHDSARRSKSWHNLSSLPLNQQAKKRHLQLEEKIIKSRVVANSEDKYQSSHQKSHSKQLSKSRSCSSLAYRLEEVYSNVDHQRSQTAFPDLRSLRNVTPQPMNAKTEDNANKLFHWFESRWNDWQRKEFLQLYIQTLDTSQIYLLYGLIMVKMYRDFISLLPEPLALKILSYLNSQDLIIAAKVCRGWKSLASRDELWKTKCKERYIVATSDSIKFRPGSFSSSKGSMCKLENIDYMFIDIAQALAIKLESAFKAPLQTVMKANTPVSKA